MANSRNKESGVVETNWAGKPEVDSQWLYLKTKGNMESNNYMTKFVCQKVLSSGKNESMKKKEEEEGKKGEDFHSRMWKLNSLILDFSVCVYTFCIYP